MTGPASHSTVPSDITETILHYNIISVIFSITTLAGEVAYIVYYWTHSYKSMFVGFPLFFKSILT